MNINKCFKITIDIAIPGALHRHRFNVIFLGNERNIVK